MNPTTTTSPPTPTPLSPFFSTSASWPASSNVTQDLVANMSKIEDDRWWENRFSEEEKRNMSMLGRVLFTGEVTLE